MKGIQTIEKIRLIDIVVVKGRQYGKIPWCNMSWEGKSSKVYIVAVAGFSPLYLHYIVYYIKGANMKNIRYFSASHSVPPPRSCIAWSTIGLLSHPTVPVSRFHQKTFILPSSTTSGPIISPLVNRSLNFATRHWVRCKSNGAVSAFMMLCSMITVVTVHTIRIMNPGKRLVMYVSAK